MHRFLLKLFASDRAYINGVLASSNDLATFAQRYISGKAVVFSSRMMDCCGRLEVYLQAE